MDVCSLEAKRIERAEQYRLVICEAWRRNGMTNKQVADATGRAPSIISKVKNGRCNICADLRHRLIDLFEMDRVRLFIAIEIAGKGELYFDPSFKSVCHASVCFVQELLTLMSDETSPEHRALFAAFSDQTIGLVAGRAGNGLTERITTIIPMITNLIETANQSGSSTRPAPAAA